MSMQSKGPYARAAALLQLAQDVPHEVATWSATPVRHEPADAGAAVRQIPNVAHGAARVAAQVAETGRADAQALIEVSTGIERARSALEPLVTAATLPRSVPHRHTNWASIIGIPALDYLEQLAAAVRELSVAAASAT